MKRRQFVNLCGLGLLAASLPVAIAACQADPSSELLEPSPGTTGDAAREDGFVVIGSVSELSEAGAITQASFRGQTVAVIRDPENPEGVVAVNALCTHQGCTVAWDADQVRFACPCHGSQFNADGSVAAGPATDDLGTFAAKIEDDLVLIQIS